MKVDGSCHCGALAFSAEIDLATVRICHCTDCQVLSGAAYSVNVQVLPGTFAITRGKPKSYTRTADSGRKRNHGFCETCSTRIYSVSVGDEVRTYNLRVGTLAQRKQLKPVLQYWVCSSLPWVENLGGMEKLERQ